MPDGTWGAAPSAASGAPAAGASSSSTDQWMPVMVPVGSTVTVGPPSGQQAQGGVPPIGGSHFVPAYAPCAGAGPAPSQAGGRSAQQQQRDPPRGSCQAKAAAAAAARADAGGAGGGVPPPAKPARTHKGMGGQGDARQTRRNERVDNMERRKALHAAGQGPQPWRAAGELSFPEQVGHNCAECLWQFAGQQCKRNPKCCANCCARLQRQELVTSPCGDWEQSRKWHDKK